jgi:hypothetical protein
MMGGKPGKLRAMMFNERAKLQNQGQGIRKLGAQRMQDIQYDSQGDMRRVDLRNMQLKMKI